MMFERRKTNEGCKMHFDDILMGVFFISLGSLLLHTNRKHSSRRDLQENKWSKVYLNYALIGGGLLAIGISIVRVILNK